MQGWHCNHHAFAYSARHGLEWWQLDITWMVICALQSIGLVWDVRLPSEKDKAARRKAPGATAAAAAGDGKAAVTESVVARVTLPEGADKKLTQRGVRKLA